MFAAVELRIPIFWDMTPYHSAIGCPAFRHNTVVLLSNGRNVAELLFNVVSKLWEQTVTYVTSNTRRTVSCAYTLTQTQLSMNTPRITMLNEWGGAFGIACVSPDNTIACVSHFHTSIFHFYSVSFTNANNAMTSRLIIY